MMENKKEKKNLSANRAQLGVRIIAFILALLMLSSVCISFFYYIYTSLAK